MRGCGWETRAEEEGYTRFYLTHLWAFLLPLFLPPHTPFFSIWQFPNLSLSASLSASSTMRQLSSQGIHWLGYLSPDSSHAVHLLPPQRLSEIRPVTGKFQREVILKRKKTGASLVVQQLRLHLPMQGVVGVIGQLRSHMPGGKKTKHKTEAVL